MPDRRHVPATLRDGDRPSPALSRSNRRRIRPASVAVLGASRKRVLIAISAVTRVVADALYAIVDSLKRAD